MITGKRRKDNDNYSWIPGSFNLQLRNPSNALGRYFFFAFISGLLKPATPINALLQVRYVSRCQ
jgi:hypothetical protein